VVGRLAELRKALGGERWPPVVLVAGQDEEARRIAVKTVVEALPEEDRSIAVESFDDAPLARAIDAVRTPSLLGGRRVVIVREPAGLVDADETARALLLGAVRKPVTQNVLVLVADKVDGRLAVVKEIVKCGVRVDCARPKEREMPAWIEQRARERGLRLGPRVVQAVAEAVGDDPALGARELDKLALFARDDGKRPAVIDDPQAVEDLLRPGRAVGAFELEDALLDGRTGPALVALETHLARGGVTDGLALLGRLAGIARRLSMADEAVAGGGNDDDVRAALSCHPFVAKKYARAARRLGHCGARALAACVAADGALKSGGAAHAALSRVVLAFDGGGASRRSSRSG